MLKVLGNVFVLLLNFEVIEFFFMWMLELIFECLEFRIGYFMVVKFRMIFVLECSRVCNLSIFIFKLVIFWDVL